MLSTSVRLAFVLATIAPTPQPRDSADERSSVSVPPSSPGTTIADSPTTAGQIDQATGDPPTLHSATELDPYRAWTLDLAAAIDAINDDPSNASGLAVLLDKTPTFTDQLGDDAAARHRRNEGLLALARAYLVRGDDKRAAETMDEALRSSDSENVNAHRYGPSLTALQDQRVAELRSAGHTTIKVECATPCRVFFNEHPAPASSRGLLVGSYRVHIVSSDGAHPPRDEVVIAAAGRVHHIAFPPAPEGPAAPEALPGLGSDDLSANAETDTDRKELVKSRRRALPRWLEITAVLGGAAAVGAGTFLLLSEDRCIGDYQTTPTSAAPGSCDTLYAARIPGITMISVGAAVIAGGVITLSIDESRIRRSRRSEAAPSAQRVMLGYSRSF